MENLESVMVAADYLQFDAALGKAVDFLHDDLSERMRNIHDIEKKYLLMYLRVFDITERFTRRVKYEHPKIDNIKTKKTTYNWEVRLLNVLLTEMERIMYHPLFLKLDFWLVDYVLGHKSLNLSEKEVLRVAKLWVRHDMKNRIKCLPKLLSCVRIDSSITV